MIFLVDASVYLFRAHHSMLPGMTDRDGRPVHVVFGFARFIGDLIERVRPRWIGVAFDQRAPDAWRSRIYPPYKANREPTPAHLSEQFARCRELCTLLGLATFVSTEFEADDLIGTLSRRMRAAGIRSAIISRDKDLAQLVRDGDLLWDFGARAQLGYHDIERHFGVRPEHFADWLALTGDAVDNIPGVPGVGPRTAAQLMKAFGSVDALYADLEQVKRLKLRGAGTLGQRLGAHREAVYLSRQLTSIRCDLPLEADADLLRRRPPQHDALDALYDRMGFGPLLRQQAGRIGQIAAA